jgi:hypothetical protein
MTQHIEEQTHSKGINAHAGEREAQNPAPSRSQQQQPRWQLKQPATEPCFPAAVAKGSPPDFDVQ